MSQANTLRTSAELRAEDKSRESELGLTAAIGRRITQLGLLIAHPLSFLVVGVYAACWLIFARDTFEWHSVATLTVWVMTLLIQRVGHRDTQAIQAKLDELLHAQGAARNELTRIDEAEPEEIARHREEARKND